MPRNQAELQADLAHVWSLMLHAGDDEDARAALALGVHLRGEWNRAPSSPDLLAVLETALQQAKSGQDAVISQGHYVLAVLYQNRALGERASHHADQAVTSAPDDLSRALALSIRCWVGVQQGAEESRLQADLAESESLAHRCGDARAQALIAGLRASVAVKYLEDYAAAEALLQQCVRMFDEQGDVAQACFRRVELALCWAWTGREAQALTVLQAAVQLCGSTGLSMIGVYALIAIGRVRVRMGDGEQARHCLEQAAKNALEGDWPALLLPALLHLAGAWALCGRARPAALLLGHTVSRWARSLGPINRPETGETDRTRALLLQALGSDAAQALIAAGGVMSNEDAIELLRQPAGDDQPAR